MRVVNLSRRPFVNRRPVLRIVVVLWVLAAVLVLANLRLFTGYLLESRDIRGQMANAEQAMREELDGLRQLDGQIARVDLGEQNRRVLFLNSLISYRTFPWSALFDDLERVIPPQVRLLSIKPVLRLASEEALSRVEAEAARNPEPRRTARQGGERSRVASASSPNRRSVDVGEEAPVAEDEVRLELSCVAENEEGPVDFLEKLYRDPKFRQPLLRNEAYSGQQVSFSLNVLYRTGERFELAPQEVVETRDDPARGDAGARGDENPTQAAATSTEVATAQTGAAAAPPTPEERKPLAPPPPRAVPTPRPAGNLRDQQLDQQVAAARRAASEQANAEEQRQNAAEADQATAVDLRRQRLEELRRRARERREKQTIGAPTSGLVLAPGGQRPNPAQPSDGANRPPAGGGESRRPPPPTTGRENKPPPPNGPETPASGTPRLGGGMAFLRPAATWAELREVRA